MGTGYKRNQENCVFCVLSEWENMMIFRSKILKLKRAFIPMMIFSVFLMRYLKIGF